MKELKIVVVYPRSWFSVLPTTLECHLGVALKIATYL